MGADASASHYLRRKNMKKREFFSRLRTAALAAVLLLSSSVSMNAFAASPEETQNSLHQDYFGSAEPVNSYLIRNKDGSFTRVEYTASRYSLIVEKYGSDLKTMKSQKFVKLPPSEFGGFYAGKKYNFVVVGFRNSSYDDSKEVFRIIKYSKDFKKLGSDSLYGANTFEPFKGGSLRMVEAGDYIFVKPCHTMYPSSRDGLNHQANLYFSYNQATDQITDSEYKVSNISKGYVSHSFNQFVAVDGDGRLVGVDQGDAYPRAIVLTRFGGSASGGSFPGAAGTLIQEFPGAIGTNYTGAKIGGLECSDSSYLVAYAYQKDISAPHNIYLASVSAGNLGDVSKTKITGYKSAAAKEASAPALVKLSANRFLLMWEIKTDYNWSGKVGYILIDGHGNKVGKAKTFNGALSDCKPNVKGKYVTWYTAEYSEKPVFYKFNYKTGKVTKTTVK